MKEGIILYIVKLCTVRGKNKVLATGVFRLQVWMLYQLQETRRSMGIKLASYEKCPAYCWNLKAEG